MRDKYRDIGGKTEILHWSPFASDGKLNASLSVKNVRSGGCEVGSPKIGAIGYRCGYGNYILNTCWRDGADRTDYAVCVDPPSAHSAIRLRVPQLLLRAGFTYGRASTYPWGIVLDDGSRCLLGVGAHDGAMVNGKRYTVDFSCSNNRYLLRDLRRGKIWKIGEVVYANGHYRRYKDVSIRRVYVGVLPGPMARQNALARQARIAASQIIRTRPAFRAIDKYPDYIRWVRLAIPDGRWARVKLENSDSQLWDILLRRVNGRWKEVLEVKKYCKKLTAGVQRQLGYSCN
jgi:hypothetical protein